MKPIEIDIDIHTLTPSEFKDHELIDIREPQEIEEWPSLQECRHIAFSEFPLNLGQFDKKRSYLLFCAKGVRSHFMAQAMTQEGYKAVSVNNGIASVNAYLKKISS
jgi:rhodanese-related sulfurtransferase